ncbi:hypothetical protein ACF09G_13080 [Streptomyces albogriseolus]|uniref:hypothetical protein n=1 Tax=Streptomyces albogriseolus TaxID=1887 RepID=UPI00225383F2|nr:hypothetical protein [Streptomyces viridodiastaticus]MCX4622799.1 hypothetical protein [Streptomyces viridodiastaticus]
MSVIDWGDVPTWLGAVFAAGAAGAAVWTLASQRRQISEQQQFIAEQTAFMAEQRQNLVLERAELEAALEERRREQAGQVRFEVSTYALRDDIDDEGNYVESEEYHLHAHVRNESREPLHEVTVRLGEVDMPEAWEFKDITPRYGPTMMRVGEDLVPPLLIAAETNITFRAGPFRGELADRPVLLFTDNDGLRWQLDEHGDLSRVAQP